MPMHDRLLARTSVTLTSAAAFLLPALPAQAHVKWLAPYIVGAPPQPVTITLDDPGFWTGIALVLAFFLATRRAEIPTAGPVFLTYRDRPTDTIRESLDPFGRLCKIGHATCMERVCQDE